MSNSNKLLYVHGVNIAHLRLVELVKLADQARPYYDFIERISKQITYSHHSLNSILLSADEDTLRRIFTSVYFDDELSRPPLFDGIGIPYSKHKASFFFLSWMIRDAPAQRLKPLISKMVKNLERTKTPIECEIDALVSLFIEYRDKVKSFSWESIREVIIDRLEGSRRSHSGHSQEVIFRSALATAVQTYFSSHLCFGKYDTVEILPKQIKVGNETIDIAIALRKNNEVKNVYFPVKTRETQGGGHAHLFSRDLIAAISSIHSADPNALIGAFIVAESWNIDDLKPVKRDIARIFYYNMNPNELESLSDDEQIRINSFISSVLDGKELRE